MFRWWSRRSQCTWIPNLPHLSIIWWSPEHHHDRGCCLPASNQKIEAISEAAIGLIFISIKYWLIYDQNFTKTGGIPLLILASSVENGL